MAQPIQVHVDQQSLYNVKTLIHGLTDAVPKITQMAVNKTLTGVRTDATNEVSKVITATKTAIRKTISVRKMTSADKTAYVRCEGKPIPLINFKARPTKKGVSVQVLKNEPRSLIKHAFIRTMKSGHKGAYWRVMDQGKRVGRLPIKELYSMAVPDVLGHPPTIKAVLDLAGSRLKKEMDAATNYYISKLK